MNGDVRNLLLELSRCGGSKSAGFNVDCEETDPTMERAISAGYISIVRDGWATGDHYNLTDKGWEAIGATPPPDRWREPTFRDIVVPGVVVCVAWLMWVVLF